MAALLAHAATRATLTAEATMRNDKPRKPKTRKPPASTANASRSFTRLSAEQVPSWAEQVLDALNRGAKAGVKTP